MRIRRRLSPLPPTRRNRRRIEARVKWLGLLVRYGFRPVVRTTFGPREPLREPALVVSNHSSLLDPMFLSLAVGRAVHFLSTELVFSGGAMGWVNQFFGAVPKRKFTADPRAILRLRRWRDLGGSIGLFPEGERTWDGRPLPILPGVEKLVRAMDLPVVTVRVYNGWRQSPRWATTLRRGRVHVEVDPPRRFTAGESLASIRRYIEDRISVDAEDGPNWPVRGRRLAAGIGNVLFACPSCLRLDAIDERGDIASCRHCGAAWRVDTESRLHPANGGRPLTLRAAADSIRGRFPEPWLPAHGPLPAGALLASEPIRLYDVTDPDPLLVGCGPVTLTAESLRVTGITPWSIPIAEIRAEAVDLKRRLNFSSRRRVFEVVMPSESVIKWELFLRHVRTRSAAPAGDLRARRRNGGG
ncbi:MAG: lysophospholipid acyltransferase family protein [Spirochaetaceae bacterium]|nr:lysophospholipid acyltransferase family protein [Spirochaetaceae bacterium]